MGNVALLLDKAKTRVFPEEYATLAVRLNVSRAVVSSWKTGKEPMPDDRIAQVARIAGEDPGVWLVRIAEEQATGEARKAWAALARQLGAAVIVVIAALPAFPAHASRSVSSIVQTERVPAIGIMRTVRMWLRSAFERFALRWARGNGSPAVLA